MTRRSARLLGKRHQDYSENVDDEGTTTKRQKLEDANRRRSYIDPMEKQSEIEARRKSLPIKKSGGESIDKDARSSLPNYLKEQSIKAGSKRKSTAVSSSETKLETKVDGSADEEPQPSTSKQIDKVMSHDETLEEINEALARVCQEQTEEDSDMSSSFTIYTSSMTLSFGRSNPLPPTYFADSSELWLSMVEQERQRAGLRDSNYLSRHSELSAKMRSILVDWLNELAHEYNIHRETFYLAVDYVDRYMSVFQNVPRLRLQLIGATAMWVASKYEEVFAATVGEFCYMTDNTYTPDEMRQQEALMLQVLKHKMSTITPHVWLATYLQAIALRDEKNKTDNVLVHHFSRRVFITCMRLLDLCIMDVESLQWPYSILAAAVLYHTVLKDRIALALAATGYLWSDIAPCVKWMAPFAWVLAQDQIPQRELRNDDDHNFQEHTVSLLLLDRVFETKQDQENSPQVSIFIPEYLTPPDSQNARMKIKARRKLQKHDEPSSRPSTSCTGKENADVEIINID